MSFRRITPYVPRPHVHAQERSAGSGLIVRAKKRADSLTTPIDKLRKTPLWLYCAELEQEPTPKSIAYTLCAQPHEPAVFHQREHKRVCGKHKLILDDQLHCPGGHFVKRWLVVEATIKGWKVVAHGTPAMAPEWDCYNRED